MNRVSFIKIVNEYANLSKFSVEIGALHKPTLKGSFVKYVDVYTTDQLKAKYSNDANVNVNDIVDVSFLSFNEMGDNAVDLVFSSHNIEHQPNLVSHLNCVGRVLRPGGNYFLCIPDYYHCFDHYKNESTIADVLASYIGNILTPSPYNIMEHHLYSSKNRHHWDSFEDNDYHKYPDFSRVKQVYERAVNYLVYQDVHCWKFSPKGFAYIIEILRQLDLIQMQCMHVYDTEKNSSEFFAHLQRLPSIS